MANPQDGMGNRQTMPSTPNQPPQSGGAGNFWRQLGQRFNPGFRNDGRNGQRVTRGILGALFGGPMGFIRGAQTVEAGGPQLPNGPPARPNFGAPSLDMSAINPQVGNPGVGPLPINQFGFSYGNAPTGPTMGLLGQLNQGTGNPNPSEAQMQAGWAELAGRTQLPNQLPVVNARGPVGRDSRAGQSAGSRTALTGQAAQDFVEGAQWGSGNQSAMNTLAMMARGNRNS